MSRKILLSIGIVGILVILVLGTRQNGLTLQGINVPEISSGNVIHSSSSVTSQGLVLITNASNTGLWFRLTNNSAVPVWCGQGASTSSLSGQAGQLLAASSTGSNVWEMYRSLGAVACYSNGTAIITFSYTGQ